MDVSLHNIKEYAENILPKRPLKIATIPSRPFVERIENSKVTYDGILFKFIDTASLVFNFSYDVIEVNGFGTKLANGSWIGVVGAVNRSEADIGATYLTVNEVRAEAVDFTMAYYEDQAGIALPISSLRKEREQLDHAIYLVGTWSFGLIVFIFLMVSILRYFSNRYTKRWPTTESARMVSYHNLMISFAAILSQSEILISIIAP